MGVSCIIPVLTPQDRRRRRNSRLSTGVLYPLRTALLAPRQSIRARSLKLGDRVAIVVGLDLVVVGEELGLGGDPREGEARDQPIVLTKEDVGVKTIADHADARAVALVLVDDVVDHER